MMVMSTFWLLGIGLIVTQTTLLQFLPLWVGRPDFVFILVADASLGIYRFSHGHSSVYGGQTFRVEEYKKPEF